MLALGRKKHYLKKANIGDGLWGTSRLIDDYDMVHLGKSRRSFAYALV